MSEDRTMKDRTFISVPFDISQIPRADYIPDKPGELYDYLYRLRNWRGESSQPTQRVGVLNANKSQHSKLVIS